MEHAVSDSCDFEIVLSGKPPQRNLARKGVGRVARAYPQFFNRKGPCQEFCTLYVIEVIMAEDQRAKSADPLLPQVSGYNGAR